jgi:hypothetical protein
MANILPRVGRLEALHLQPNNQRSKPDGKFARNAERTEQSGYEMKRRLAPEQSCFYLENPEKGGKGTRLESKHCRFIRLEVPKAGRR